MCGVERRKYLTRFDFKNPCWDEDGKVLYKTSDKLYNLDTSHCFSIDPNLLTLKEAHYNNQGSQEYCALYEGKIKMIAPIPINSMMITEYMIEHLKNADRSNLYLECFDLSDVPDIYVYNNAEVLPMDASTELSYVSYNCDGESINNANDM